MEIPVPALLVDLESVLRRRGHLPIKQGDTAQILYPEDRISDILVALGQFEYVKHFSPEFIAPYLGYFGKASFRKVARRLLRNGRELVAVADLEAIAGSSAGDYLAFLARLQMLEREGESVRLTREINNLGPSLEHYVAQLCIRELRGAAEWGVVLEGLPRAGGDYDVLAWLDPSLMYVECKSGRPSDIDESSLREFLQRSEELAPELAVLLIDTSDDLSGFVDGTLNPILRQALGSTREAGPIQMLEDYPRVSYGYKRIYVTNSKPNILMQLRRCLQHYYAHVKGVSFWEGDPVNFTAAPVRDEGANEAC